MHYLPIALFSAVALAAPRSQPWQRATYSDFQMTDVQSEVNNYGGSKESIKFTFNDPNDATSTNCTGTWAYQEAPTEWVSCVDTKFAFKFSDYTGWGDFEIYLEHGNVTGSTHAEGTSGPSGGTFTCESSGIYVGICAGSIDVPVTSA